TLKDMKKIMPLLRQFREDYYTADRMTLLLTSSHDLDILERFARSYFSSVPKAKKPIPKLKFEPRYTKEYLHTKASLESLQGNNILAINFLWNENKTLEIQQAIAYILLLMGTDSEG